MTKKYLFNLLMVLGLVGLTGITAVLAQDSNPMPPEQKAASDSSGTYSRKAGKSSDNLELAADKKATWTVKAEGKEDIVLSGTWEESGGSVMVTIPAKDPAGKDAQVTFKASKNQLEVTAATPEGLLPIGTKFQKDKT